MMKRTEDETRGPGSTYQFLDLTDAGQTDAAALMGILYPSSSGSANTAPPPQHPPPGAIGFSRKEESPPRNDSFSVRMFAPRLTTPLPHQNGLNPNARAFDPVPVVILPRPTAMMGIGGGGVGVGVGSSSKSRSPGKEFAEQLEAAASPLVIASDSAGGGGGAVVVPPHGGGMVLVPVRKHSLVPIASRPLALPDQPQHPQYPQQQQPVPPSVLVPTAGNVGFMARSSLLPGGGGGGGPPPLRPVPPPIVSATATSSAPPLPTFGKRCCFKKPNRHFVEPKSHF
uniref:Uncharacterized protein n=1 Tax=Anopheles melas TaxID=34690 RepID=A0A182TGC0_9DIPT